MYRLSMYSVYLYVRTSMVVGSIVVGLGWRKASGDDGCASACAATLVLTNTTLLLMCTELGRRPWYSTLLCVQPHRGNLILTNTNTQHFHLLVCTGIGRHPWCSALLCVQPHTEKLVLTSTNSQHVYLIMCVRRALAASMVLSPTLCSATQKKPGPESLLILGHYRRVGVHATWWRMRA